MTPSTTPRKKHGALRLACYAVAAVILTGSLLLSYMYWEANNLTYKETEAPQHCLPTLSGMRILVLSDIHTNPKLLEDAVTLAKQAKPDLIVFLGDLYTDYLRTTYTGKYIDQFKQLSELAPSYACLGNHDMALIPTVERTLKEGGFTLMRNSSVFLNIPRLGDKEFKLVGLSDLREGDFFPEKCMTPFEFADNPPTPTIVLCHNPQGREFLRTYHWDLMLSGHTHGGQIRLPFCASPLLLRDGETMSSGFYPYEGRHLFISPGIGYGGPGRFNCPPEINLITIP